MRKDNPIQHPCAEIIRLLAKRISSEPFYEESFIVLSDEEKRALIWASFLVDDDNALFGIVPRK